MEPSSEMKIYERENIKMQLLSALDATMESFEKIWKEFGITEHQIWERANVVLGHTTSLLEDLLKEETDLYISLKNKVLKYLEQMKAVCLDLNLEVEEPDMDLPLLQKEKVLKTKLDALENEKYSRLKQFKQLSKKESMLCNLLAMPKTASSKGNIPTRQELKELEENIRMLTDERERRYKKFCSAKRELTTIMEVSEFSPETSFEREIVCYDDDDTIVLSNENLQQITMLVTKFKDRKLQMEEEIKTLQEKLQALWDRLNIDKLERKKFLDKFSECRQSTLSAIKHEIKRCEEIKKQNIEEYIKKLRSELSDLWEKCYISEEQRQKFTAYHATDFTEELLDLHDKEVEKMKTHYELTEDILQKIEKRKALWELMLKFEMKATDPNRFHNRRGNLLQEERERKRILKDLPRLEEEILKAIEEYEEDADELFLINGVNFADYIANQWADHVKEKENKKLERQQQRGLQTDGQLYKTPSKRPLLSSPASGPSKMSRTNLGFSAVCTLAPRVRKAPTPYTPADYAKRKTSRKKFPMHISQTPQSSVLIEKNSATPLENNHNDTTSYSQFAVELEKHGKERCRSSVLVSRKKVLGSKVSHRGTVRKSLSRTSQSSRKSSNYSLRSLSKVNAKSFRNTSRTPTKQTPARAKLGLPFLI